MTKKEKWSAIEDAAWYCYSTSKRGEKDRERFLDVMREKYDERYVIECVSKYLEYLDKIGNYRKFIAVETAARGI